MYSFSSRSSAVSSFILLLLSWCAGTSALALTAPDASESGPLKVVSADYNLFPAGLVDPDILVGVTIEIRGRLYRPAVLENRTYPLIVFLHGNHATCGFFKRVMPDDPTATDAVCVPNPPLLAPVRIRDDSRLDYTRKGSCPSVNGIRYFEAPSYRGYDYLAERLASHGYVVVSINANRGITGGAGIQGDEALIFARGRLVLRHLQNLVEWNSGKRPTPTNLGVDLRNKLDFHNVGLLGHSRGGEGVRAAYNLYRNDTKVAWQTLIPVLDFKGIFEIAPTDIVGLDANGVAWNVILPLCDGDVSELDGLNPFDRMLARSRLAAKEQENPATQKSTYSVWGANHNFFNTQWQFTDFAPISCGGPTTQPKPLGNQPLFGMFGGSHGQRLVALSSVLAFFRANVGSQSDLLFNRNLNPSLYQLPTSVHNENNQQERYGSCYRIDRGNSPSPISAIPITRIFDDFDKANGFNSADDPLGTRVPNDQSGLCLLDANGRVMHVGVPGHLVAFIHGAQLCWNAADMPGAPVHFQSNWMAPGQNGSFVNGKTLDLRVARRVDSVRNNPGIPTNLSIALVNSAGDVSRKVSFSTYSDLRGPVQGALMQGILQTVRIPLVDFGNFDLTKVRGVRFIFDQTPKGSIYLANLRISNSNGPGTLALASPSWDSSAIRIASESGAIREVAARSTAVYTGQILAIRRVAASTQLGGQAGVEVEIFSQQSFPVRNRIARMRVAEATFALSRYKSDELNTLVFTMTDQEFSAIAPGSPVTVEYDERSPSAIWDCGVLDKGILEQLAR